MDRYEAAQPVDPADLSEVLAVVLAGGRGERLGPLTTDCAKPAVPFGGGYRVIDFTLSNCANSGIDEIALLTQYRSTTIAEHVARAWSGASGSGARVRLWDAARIADEGGYRGTADAVYRNLAGIEREQPRLVLILSGDHVYRMDYRRMVADHLRSGAEVTVGCIEAPLVDASRYGVLGTDPCTRIDSFAEKPANPVPTPHRPDRALVSMGIYLFDARVLADELRADAALSDSRHDFGADVIPRIIHTRRVHAHRFEQPNGLPCFWRDIGTLDSYHEASLALLDSDIGFEPADPRWPVHGCAVSHHPARFRQPNGAGGRDRTHRGRRSTEGLVVRANVGAGCLIDGGMVVRSILSEAVTVRTGAVVSDSVLLPGAVVGEEARLHRTIVTAGCSVPAGVRMGVAETDDTIPCLRTPGGVRVLTQADVDRWLAGVRRRRAPAPLAAGVVSAQAVSNA
jgi:glucose-1-phosphate adenylyltransferase